MKALREREIELKNIFRYNWKWGGWDTMFYRPHLLIHTKRVSWITQELTEFLGNINPNIFDKSFTDELAIFHDDSEILTWDLLSLEKEMMSKEEKEAYEKECLNSIKILDENYWHHAQLNYQELLLADHYKKWIEYLIVAYADKLDAHMEIFHEILAWNELTIKKLTNWNLDIYPHDYTRNKIIKLIHTLSNNFWVKLIDTHDLFQVSQDFNTQLAYDNAKFHAKNNIQNDSWYKLYEAWKKLHFKYWDKEDREYLYSQREFTN